MRSDLLKRLFHSHQQRDDRAFRLAADEIIQEERKKQHPVVAIELERALKNGHATGNGDHTMVPYDPPPMDAERRTTLLEVRTPRRYLDDVILSPQLKAAVDRLMVEFRAWEVLEANGIPPLRRVLFCGPSGSGKTVTAEAIAAELGLALLYVRFDAVVSSLLGETAANLRKVFEYARRGQWVMLFDEFDAIGRSRDDPTEHGEIKRVVNSFLQILDNFDGHSLIIAATNFEESLDLAIWRRFDDVLRFDQPGTEQLRALVKRQIGSLHHPAAVVDELVAALSSASFADAERVCLDVRRACAIRGDRRIQPEDVASAVSRYVTRLSVLERVGQHEYPAVDRG